MRVFGFSMVHNGIRGGYPFAEAIRAVRNAVDGIAVVDMQSDDGTRAVLERLDVAILESHWTAGNGDRVLLDAFALHQYVSGDAFLLFEADEVYDPSLALAVREALEAGHDHVAVHRLQLEQNFQRCRWYPWPTIRGFIKGSSAYIPSYMAKPDPTAVHYVSPDNGFLWDCSNCFRDNWHDREAAQDEIWGKRQKRRMVAWHFTEPNEISDEEFYTRFQAERWTWTATPFAIPEVLKPHVGKTRYRPLTEES